MSVVGYMGGALDYNYVILAKNVSTKYSLEKW